MQKHTHIGGKVVDMQHAARKVDRVTVYDYMTFRNIALAAAALAVLVVAGVVVSWTFAVVLVVLGALAVFVVIERRLHRAWERDAVSHIQHLNSEIEKLTAEAADLRQKLAEANTPEGQMAAMVAGQLKKLSGQPEKDLPLADIRALGFDPAIFNTGPASVDAGSHLTDEQVLGLINAAITHDRVDLFLQPMVALPQRKPRFYETFSRIRIATGIYLSADRYIDIATKNGKAPAIDNLLLLRGLQLVRQVGAESAQAFFFNVTGPTLHDPAFMNALVEFIAHNRKLASRLVLEMSQRDLLRLEPDTQQLLDGLSRLGCRFSMDHVKRLAFDYDYLEAHHVRFIKIDASLLLAEQRTKGGGDRLRRLKTNLDRAGIDIIVEKIETERQLLALVDLGIDYGQGYLFGRPTLHETKAA